jgi:hypothetical protein
MSVELDHPRRDALSPVPDMQKHVPPVDIRWLGRMNFADAVALQEKIVAQKRSDPTLADTVLLLEHDPVYTIGRTPDQTSLRGGSHLLHPFFQINRARPVNGLSHYRSTKLWSGFAQIFALD